MTERDSMADLTRRIARRDEDERTPEGSHDFPDKGSRDDDAGHEHQHQQGTGQSDDVSGKAPASGMARQHANPARR
jgi:hypothetical protein